MRVISQDGNFDLPYENLAIFIEYENIVARFENERFLLAQYSTKEKAIKAMEALRETYTHPYIRYFQFPQDSEIEVSE